MFAEYDPSTCGRCRAAVPEGKKVCECGSPTSYMSFEERNVYEVERYRAMMAKQQSA